MDDAGIEGIGEVVEELLALPPESFTERRNAIAKELRAAGRRDAAEAVKVLPRPSVALWAINRLAREQPGVIDAFLAAADDLRRAYRDGGDIRAATRPERDAEAAVIAAAGEFVRAAGKPVSDTVVQGLGQIVHAAAAAGQVADELRSGRLIREPAAPSIGDLLGSITVAPTAPARASARVAAKKDDTREAERQALREEIATAESDASRARQELRAALAAADEARAAWEAAQARAAELQRSSEAADESLGALRERLERL